MNQYVAPLWFPWKKKLIGLQVILHVNSRWLLQKSNKHLGDLHYVCQKNMKSGYKIQDSSGSNNSPNWNVLKVCIYASLFKISVCASREFSLGSAHRRAFTVRRWAALIYCTAGFLPGDGYTETGRLSKRAKRIAAEEHSTSRVWPEWIICNL